MTGEIRWGILGCGDVTERKSGPAFQNVPGSRLVAVMRRDGDKARDYATRHGVPRWYDRAESLLADPEVDAIYVATPPSSHEELALACAAAGKPTYVEKPMALDHGACTRMIDAFRARSVPLFVAYYRRALPRFQRIAELLGGGSRGPLGAVRSVRIHLTRSLSEAERAPATWPWRVRPEIAGGGHFVDLACHTLDFLDFALGPIEDVFGLAENLAGAYPAEDTVAACFRFASGALGAGTWSFASFDRQDEVVVELEKGRVRFATFADEPIVVTTSQGREEHVIPHPPAIQRPLVEAIVGELLGRGVRCPSTGETAARTTRVMDRILAGYRARSEAPPRS